MNLWDKSIFLFLTASLFFGLKRKGICGYINIKITTGAENLYNFTDSNLTLLDPRLFSLEKENTYKSFVDDFSY